MAKTRRYVAILLTFGPAWAGAASADTYYLGLSGDDSNPGTAIAPIHSFARAMTMLKPGDELIVQGGTYTKSNSDAFRVTASGTPDGFVTVTGDPGNRPVITPEAGNGVEIGGSYVTVRGFEISAAAARDSDGVEILPGTHHIRIVGNYIHDNGGAGISAIRSDYVTIENNVVAGNSRKSPFQTSGITIYQAVAADSEPGFHDIIQANAVTANAATVAQTSGPNIGHTTDGNGIMIDDFRGDEIYNGTTVPPYAAQTLVQNNIVYANGGRGIYISRSQGVTVENNTVWHNLQDPLLAGGPLVEIGAFQSGNCVFVNNIADASAASGYALADVEGQSDQLDYNLLHGGQSPGGPNLTNAQGSVWGTHNLGNADPMLAFPQAGIVSIPRAAYNFAPRSGSPAIGAGSIEAHPPYDVVGNRRSLAGPVDIGAVQVSPALGRD